MQEFWNTIVNSPINLSLSIMLVAIVLYWLMVIIGAIGIDAIDFDFDADVDADIDMDADGGHLGAWGLLRWLGVGEVPLMMLISVLILTLWLIGMLSYPLIGSWSILLQLGALIPMVLVGIIATRILTYPLAKLYAKLREDEKREAKYSPVGMRAKVVSLTLDQSHGQIEIIKDDNNILLNARIKPDEDVVCKKGDEVTVLQKDKENDLYIVTRL